MAELLTEAELRARVRLLETELLNPTQDFAEVTIKHLGEDEAPVSDDEDEPAGPGWYYCWTEYEDEGWMGPYDTRDEVSREAFEHGGLERTVRE